MRLEVNTVIQRGGKPLGSGIARDLTERKLSEDALRESRLFQQFHGQQSSHRFHEGRPRPLRLR